jgi:hypothetical protein
MLRRAITIAVIAVFAVLVPAAASFATIHPIVESFDCADEQAFANHPLGDPADPIGQTPEVGSHSDQSTLRALQEASDSAFSEFKLDGACGAGG